MKEQKTTFNKLPDISGSEIERRLKEIKSSDLLRHPREQYSSFDPKGFLRLDVNDEGMEEIIPLMSEFEPSGSFILTDFPAPLKRRGALLTLDTEKKMNQVVRVHKVGPNVKEDFPAPGDYVYIEPGADGIQLQLNKKDETYALFSEHFIVGVIDSKRIDLLVEQADLERQLEELKEVKEVDESTKHIKKNG